VKEQEENHAQEAVGLEESLHLEFSEHHFEASLHGAEHGLKLGQVLAEDQVEDLGEGGENDDEKDGKGAQVA